MEDILHFLECYSRYVFRGDVLSPQFKEMWDLLRAACEHYFRAVTVEDPVHPYTPESRLAARQSLLQYSKLVQEVNF